MYSTAIVVNNTVNTQARNLLREEVVVLRAHTHTRTHMHMHIHTCTHRQR